MTAWLLPSPGLVAFLYATVGHAAWILRCLALVLLLAASKLLGMGG